MSKYSPIVVILLLAAAFWAGRWSVQLANLPGAEQAGEAAGDQKKEGAAGEEAPTPNSSPLSVSNLKAGAADLGLEMDKFNSCLSEGKYEKKIKNDVAEGNLLGVSGTPTYFINGVMVVGALPQGQFEKVIEAELKDGSGDKVTGVGAPGTELVRKDVKYGVGWVEGEEEAEVKIAVFSEFECLFCKRAFPTEEALMEKYKGKINLEFRHYPLPFHAYAQKAAEASECAGEQGKFWEMHDRLFGEGE